MNKNIMKKKLKYLLDYFSKIYFIMNTLYIIFSSLVYCVRPGLYPAVDADVTGDPVAMFLTRSNGELLERGGVRVLRASWVGQQGGK